MSDRIATNHAAVPEVISKLDVDVVGVASLDDQKSSKLAEIANRLLPEARSLVVFAMETYTEVLRLHRPGRTMGAASLNELLTLHNDYLAGRLNRAVYDVVRASRRNGLKALPLPAAGCPTDGRFLEAIISYKHAAQAAGLGYIGKSSLLVTPEFGPRVRLACCLTEAELEPTDNKVPPVTECQSCSICIDNCPSGALAQPKAGEPCAINRFACASFLNASGGCCECLRLCPARSRAEAVDVDGIPS